MNIDQPFHRKFHHSTKRFESPMHSHHVGQLIFVREGVVHLIAPDSAWVVPRDKIVWTPPGQLHYVKCEKLSQSWRVMTPRYFSRFLPETTAVLKSSHLLIAALESLPDIGETSPPKKFNLLKQIIEIELSVAKRESFGTNLPKSPKFAKLVEAIMRDPLDPRGIDQWARELGMARRTFTRFFYAETGLPFTNWKNQIVLSKALDLLFSGKSVSDVAFELEYSSPSSFILAFRKRYGESPAKFIRRHKI